MPDGPGGPEGPAVGAGIESVSAPSIAETSVTTISPETPIAPGGTLNETIDNTTGSDAAAKITDEATKTGPDDLLKDIADGKTFSASQDAEVFKKYQKMMNGEQSDDPNEPSIKPDENPVTFKNPNEYRDNFTAVDADDINTNTPQNTENQTPASPPEDNTKTNQPSTENNQTSADPKADVKEAPAPANKTPDAAQTQTPVSTPESDITKQKPTTETPIPDKAEQSPEAKGTSEEQKPEKKPTPEEAAKKEAISYFSKHLDKWQQALNDPNIENVGGDFAITKYKAYIKQTQEGKFFDEIKVSGTFDGNPINTTQKSPYEFFKGIADNTDKIVETFKDNPKIVADAKIEGEEAKIIADTMEKFKPPKDETSPKQNGGEKINVKEIPENEFKSPGDIQSEIQNIFPEYNPEDPASKEFLENLKNNPDQTNAVSDALKLAGDQKAALEKTVSENPDLLKNLGIKDFSDIMKSTARDTIKYISDTLETGIKELAGKANPTKEDEDKKKKDGILLMLLKALGQALGTVLTVGGAAALAAGKEMKK